MYAPGSLVYMDKIAVGPEAAGQIDLDAPVRHNLEQVAKALGKSLSEVTAIILDRERNSDYIRQIREAGARIRLIRDGDISAAIATCVADSGIDILCGIGGSPEAVTAGCALKSLRGEMQTRLWPRNDAEREYAEIHGHDLEQILTLDDLIASDNTFFSATGVTTGELLDGVRYSAGGAETHSIVMRSGSGTVRYIRSQHRPERVRQVDEMVAEA